MNVAVLFAGCWSKDGVESRIHLDHMRLASGNYQCSSPPGESSRWFDSEERATGLVEAKRAVARVVLAARAIVKEHGEFTTPSFKGHMELADDFDLEVRQDSRSCPYIATLTLRGRAVYACSDVDDVRSDPWTSIAFQGKYVDSKWEFDPCDLESVLGRLRVRWDAKLWQPE